MKKILLGISFIFCVASNISFVYSNVAVAKRFNRSAIPVGSRYQWGRMIPPRGKNGSVTINRLMRVEAATGSCVSQITLEFLKPLYCKVREAKVGEQVKLYFPGQRLSDFKHMGIVEKIKKLAVVKRVALANETYEEVPVPSPTLTIDFIKGSVSLGLTKAPPEEPNLLVLDIYDKEKVKVILYQATTIRKASNNVLSDFHSGKKKLFCLNSSKKKRQISPFKANIVIDAGHGGKDPGSCSFGMNEKSITLDIARRVFSTLKKEGYRVFLTRNTDSYLSVVDRFQLAQQLKADLFVSVHVNAVAGIERVSGIETHFLDGRPFFGRRNRNTFLFVENDDDKKLVKGIKRLLYEKITASKVLSKSIQTSILSSLRKKNISVVDRGVKQTAFRTLLRSEVPSSIVEVGFLTNKREAKLLSRPLYRNLLARGICNGIKESFNFFKI